MKQIFSNWNASRIFRLVLSVIIIVQGIVDKDWMIAGLGVLFALLPIFNLGCCNSAACNTTIKMNKKNQKDAQFEELP